MKRIIIQIVLFAVILVLAFFVYRSIMAPVEFNKQLNKRKNVVVERLMDIRTAQMTYKSVNNQFCSSFDTLIDFLKNGQLPLVLKLGSIPDSLVDKIGETEALEMGLITRDTTMIFVRDTLFKDRENFNVENLRYVPFTNQKDEFTIAAGKIDRSSFLVPVFEVSADWEVILQGLDEQMIKNMRQGLLDIEKFPGLKVGSMIDPSTDGNWE